jgi:hypothetical protein
MNIQMKELLCTSVLLCVALSACASTQVSSTTRHELDTSITQLCQWTGMQRVGLITSIERWHTSDPGYTVRLRLAVDGTGRPFIIRFDSHRRLFSFEPDPFDLSGMARGLGADTLKSTEERRRCIGAVARLKRHLQWRWYGRAAIQPLGSNFIVTYLTIPPAQRDGYLDPYVSFVVSQKGTIFVSFSGA